MKLYLNLRGQTKGCSFTGAVCKAEHLEELNQTSLATQVALQQPPVVSALSIKNALYYFIEQSRPQKCQKCPRCGNDTFLRHAGIRVLSIPLTYDYRECTNCRYHPAAEFRQVAEARGNTYRTSRRLSRPRLFLS
jgi:hypothetical protein